MAYRRRHRRSAFSKRQVRAIEAIAKGEVETKNYVFFVAPQGNSSNGNPNGNAFLGPELFSNPPYVPATLTGRYAINLYGWIPRNVTPAAPSQAITTSEQIVGNEFDSIGVVIRPQIAWQGTRNWRIRISVVSADWKDVFSPVNSQIAGTNQGWMEGNTFFDEPTIQGFSPAVNVLNQRNFSSTVDGNSLRNFRMWTRISGRKKLMVDDQLATTTTTQSLAGKNYFAIIEWYIPGNAMTTSDWVNMQFEVGVYFKDP